MSSRDSAPSQAFDRLLEEAHERDLRVILDWVGNHTSAQHPWFRDSRSSRSSARRNWYLWRDARPDGSPPNNWVSVFGGSVWQWDAADLAVLHAHVLGLATGSELALAGGPRSDARCPEVLARSRRRRLSARCGAAVLQGRSVARQSSRIPTIGRGELPDGTLLPIHTRNQPGLHELFAELRASCRPLPRQPRAARRVLRAVRRSSSTFYGDRSPELHLPLNLSLTWSNWDARTVGRTIADYQAAVSGRGWPTTTLDTHDQHRIVARAGIEQARVATMLLLTQRGTPTLYYGDEIGMRGVDIPPSKPSIRRAAARAATAIRRAPRCNGAVTCTRGFSTVEPWLPVGVDRDVANVASQSRDAGSLLTLTGACSSYAPPSRSCRTVRKRRSPQGSALVAYRQAAARRGSCSSCLNFAHERTRFALRGDGRGASCCRASSIARANALAISSRLRADEGLVLALDCSRSRRARRTPRSAALRQRSTLGRRNRAARRAAPHRRFR